MLTRLFLLVTALWAAICLWAGANRGDGSGIERSDVVLAFLPMLLGWLLARAARFVVTGSVGKPRIQVYRRPR